MINFIDLFAGCGGLTEGFYRQGYNALAHVEIDHFACETLKTRMRHYGYTEADSKKAVGILQNRLKKPLRNTIQRLQIGLMKAKVITEKQFSVYEAG